MNVIKVGIICPAEVAIKRFLPALNKCPNMKYIGVAIADRFEFEDSTNIILQQEQIKVERFIKDVGGKLFSSYSELVHSNEVDVIYMPLPPGLHYKWVKKALLAGKHVIVEKPCAATLEQTLELIEIARNKSLTLHENYAFIYHRQIYEIQHMIKNGVIGDIRLFRINFGFPFRSFDDFRYNKRLAGGALLDCAGQTLCYASLLLGDTAKVVCCHRNYIEKFDVDMYGSATMMNYNGLVAQLSWGMDNCYRCELDIWGSKGTLRTGRILTAPAGFVPTASIKIGNEPEQIIKLPEDDAFMNSIIYFSKCIDNSNVREENYEMIIRQSRLIDSCYSDIIV